MKRTDNQLEVQEIQQNLDDWDQFARSRPEVGYYHLWPYLELIEETYGYKATGFLLRKDGQVIAILPAILSNSILFGRKLVSQPFSEYGGILSSGMTENDYAVLIQHLKEFCFKRRILSLEIHGNIGIPESIKAKYFHLANPYRYAILKLGTDPALIRKTIFDYQIRKALNKAERGGIRSFQDSGQDIIRKKFWPLFLESMKRLGSPPHPLEYFTGLQRNYPDELKIFWAEANNKLVSALLGFAIGKRIQITHIVSDESYWELRPNDVVHWEFIKWGCENGYEEFDFGSIRYEGQLRYKKKWGAEIRNCGYYYLSNRPEAIKTFSSSSKMMTVFSRVWGKAMPLSLTTVLGPMIRKLLVR